MGAIDRHKGLRGCAGLRVLLGGLLIAAIVALLIVSGRTATASGCFLLQSVTSPGEVRQEDSKLLNNSGTAASTWPGQPVYDIYDAASTKAHTGLVRIGRHLGPLENSRDYVLQHLDEFLQVYSNRPDKTNTCGIRINHAMAIYMTTKRLRPTTIIESGINSGQSTYFFRSAAGPSTKIISIDPMAVPICGQPVRWIDTTNNDYLTGPDKFVDFSEVDWAARDDVDPATTLVFIDDHRGFFLRFPAFIKYGFRHVMNEDNYKAGEGATPQDKAGWTPKQMFAKPQPIDANTAWLFANLKVYAEFPPLLPPSLSKDTPWPYKPQGGFLHSTSDLRDVEEPILRPDISTSDVELFEHIATTLTLDKTMMETQSFQEFMGYCFLAYMELVPMAPLLAAEWKL